MVTNEDLQCSHGIYSFGALSYVCVYNSYHHTVNDKWLLYCFSQNSTVCELYGSIREKWTYLSKDPFKLSNGVTEISPDYGSLQLDDWNINLHDKSTVIVTFPTVGGTIQPST